MSEPLIGERQEPGSWLVTYKTTLLTMRRWSLLLSAALFFFSAFLGSLAEASGLATGLTQSLAEELLPIRGLSPLALFVVIFLNNGVKALVVIVLGFALGIAPGLFLLANGFVAGAVIYHALPAKGAAFTAASLLPHGIIEIPAFLMAAALGFQLAGEGLKLLRRQKSQPISQLRACLSVYMHIIAPALLVAAATEVLMGKLLGAF